ncbi:MAG: hypothetical protein ACPL1D_01915 [Microgenomates group bacterium]
MNFTSILLFFSIWRAVDFIIIILAKNFIPYLGFFPYKELLDSLNRQNIPQWLTSLANFDGIYYLLLSKHNYRQYEQAFFPLYPLLIRFLTPVFFNNQFLTAFFISNLSFLFGLYFFSQYLKEINQKNSFFALLLILFYPTSFYFGAIYTEGLFFLLLSLTLYNLKKNRLIFAALTSFFASLTRIIGIFLFIPIFFRLWQDFKKKRILQPQTFIVLFSPFLGISLYCLYLWQTTGDPFFFFTSQPAFGANRSTTLISLPQVYYRYIKIFFTASFNFQYFIALIEFFIFTFVLAVLIIDFFQLLSIKKTGQVKLRILNIDLFSLNLFSLVNLLLPSLTGTFSSIPRYSLFSLSFFVFLAKIKSYFFKFLILFFFLIFHILMLAFFSQGYFVS